ncbi:MAG: sulfite exporter TauE/SafE family protein [Alphaproteobacteria bacterium]|nr:sulfite exporter TauE/SafE family protein [Alphaproteobacteria bacterium]
MVELTLDTWQQILLASATALAGGAIRGFAGFGGPIVMILVLNQFYLPASVLPKVVIIDFASNVFLVPNTLRQVPWPTATLTTLASLVITPLGLWVLMTSDPVLLKKLCAAVGAVSAVAMMMGVRYRGQPTDLLWIAAGLTGGFVNGATTIAMVMMILIYAGPDPARTSRAHAVAWAFFIGIALMFAFTYVGQIGLQDYIASAAIAPAYLGGTWIGSRLFRVISEVRFRRMLLYLVLALAIIGLVR